jgi:uncharacterized membrane protein HdeD (DUF308 family)
MDRDDGSLVGSFTGLWWVFLIVGIAWFMVSLVLFRFDLTSVAAVGALLGALFVVAGINEFAAMAAHPDWRWLHGLMGALFLIGSVWAFVHPIGSAVELASIFGFLMILKGSFDLVGSALSREVNELWVLGVIIGGLEILLGFWASQTFIKPVLELIVLWAGFMALFRGVSEIVLAFTLRSMRKQIAVTS